MPRRLPDLPREEEPRAGQLAVLRRLVPYLWPAGRWDLRLRVLTAAFLLIAAKLVTVYTPFFYKRAVDLLEDPAARAIAVPAALLAAYGMARFLAVALAQLRDWVFTRVSQHALRTLALETFRHL
ncbi:MAG: metal ABC transporter permease, partial [Rhodothalassiaceae bacterium]